MRVKVMQGEQKLTVRDNEEREAIRTISTNEKHKQELKIESHPILDNALGFEKGNQYFLYDRLWFLCKCFM